MKLTISRDNIVIEERRLENGVYVVGREASCDIQLPDQGVSREHCRLEVADATIEVQDLGSTNGIGYHGKKITRKRIKPPFTLTVGPFQLLVESRENRRGRSFGSFLQYSLARYPRGLFACCLAVVVLLAFWAGRAPLEKQIRLGNENFAVAQAVRVARAIAEMNRDRLFSGDKGGLTVVPFDRDKGVVSALILNEFGSVLAPEGAHFQGQDHPLLEKAIRTGNYETITNPDEEITVFYPVKGGGTIMGAVSVIYRETNPLVHAADGAMESGLSLFGVLVAALILSLAVWKIWRYPLKELTAAVNIAVQENAVQLAIKNTSTELSELKVLVDRLLFKACGDHKEIKSGQTDHPASSTAVPVNKASRQSDHNDADGSSLSLPGELPACIIDLRSAQLLESTPAFIELFHGVPGPGSHLLEVIPEPAIVELVNGNADQVLVTIDGQTYAVQSSHDPGGSFMMLSFVMHTANNEGVVNE